MIPRSRAARLPSAALIGIALLSGMGLVVGDSHAGATWRVDPDGGGDALTIAGGVALASEGDTIRIAAATYPETIAIEKGISFIGVGGDVIWQGNGTASCLSIQNSAPFRLEGIIFEGGGGTEGGGLDARNVYGGFTVVACTFRDMTVTGTAAGIYTLQTSPLIADSCVFSNLEATGSLSGGVLSGGNGGTFRGCEFLNCTGIRGGGLSVAGEGNLIENCTFDGCEANFAGALNLYGADDTTVRGCTFSGNRANYTGGAIDLEGTGHLIENSRFSENTAPASGGAINAFNGSGNTVRANLFF
ncbi:MAG: hypothetical protein FJY88_13715, partial [Candidatus Eisenbacteria bacterium]|nr:hypothetical protein [Candidatus Eisenbacteria bacterium]